VGDCDRALDLNERERDTVRAKVAEDESLHAAQIAVSEVRSPSARRSSPLAC
jgi:hypothetical protein